MKKIIIALSYTFLLGSVAAQDMFAKKSLFSPYEATVEKYQVISGKSTIGEYPQLQIGEKMRVVYANVSSSTGVSIPLGRITLFSEREKKLLYAVDTIVNLEPGRMSGWTDEPCKRDNFLWKRSIGGEFQNINCASINHFTEYYVYPTGDFQQIVVWAKDEGIEIPPTIIRVSFTRYSSGGKRIVYVVDINPEQYGIARDATMIWGSSSWHKDFIKRDPRKVEFIEKLKLWATDVQDQMDRALNKDGKAFVGMKNLDEYLRDSVKKEGIPKVANENTTEQKLIRLKTLYEKGLMTESQYNDQVKEVLSGN
jgi:hypothetical protein